MGMTLQLILAGAAALATASAQTTITISPTTAQVHLGTFYQFSAHVTGATNTTVGWTVALASGATGSPGTISAGGRYTPPSVMPSVNSVTVTATSLATPTASASAQVTLENPFPTVASTIPASLPTGSGSYTLTINGSGFVSGAQVFFGGVGLATTYVSATRLTAGVTPAGYAAGARVPIKVTNPNPGSATSTDAVTVEVGSTDGPPAITATVASRFLNQAAFGPDAVTAAHVESLGLAGYIKEQLTVPISPYPDPSTTGFGLGQVQARFFANAVEGRDQLRQRVAFAMGEMFVVSAITETTPSQIVPYLQILQKDAFVELPHADGGRHAKPHHGRVPRHAEQRQGQHRDRYPSQRELCARADAAVSPSGCSSSIRMERCNSTPAAIRSPLTIRPPSRISPKFTPAGRIRQSPARRSRSTTRHISLGRWWSYESNHDTTARLC